MKDILCPKCGEQCEVETDWRIKPGTASTDYPAPVSSCCDAELEIPEDDCFELFN